MAPLERGQDHSTGDLSHGSPRAGTDALTQDAESSGSSMDAKDSARKNRFVIRNIKLPGEVPDFRVSREKFSVHKYFRTKLHRSLEYPSLPLAEIGRDTWVPLETLVTSGDQMIPHRKLTRTLMKRARKAYELDEYHEHFAKELANDIVEPLNEHLRFDESAEIPMATFEALTPKGSKKSAKRRPKIPKERDYTIANQPMVLKCGIVHVKAKGVQRDSAINFKTLVENLKVQCKPGNSARPQLIEIDPDFEHPIVSIADTKPLQLLPDFGGSTELQTLYKGKPNTIIAIIDSTGRSASELRNIRAELQKFGNRVIGAVTYCMTEKNLEESMQANVEKIKYFLQRIIEELTVMHGQPLFTTDVLDGTDRVANPMVIGAHISHPHPGCAEHCPSVAALVGSVDDGLTKFPGSVRLQPTYRSSKWHEKHLKRTMESHILDLEDMMVERLNAWKKDHAEAVPSVVFYRNSIGFLDNTVIETEKNAITTALKTVFSARISFTYIVANKCQESPYDIQWKRRKAAAGVNHFTTCNLEDFNKGRRYRYFVEPATEACPRLNLDMAHLARLTYSLNTSFQLGKYVAIALPLHYARKLACHTFNYFRFAVTNQYDIVSSVTRRLHGDDLKAEANGKEMVKMMHEYLFSDSARGNSSVAQPFGRTNPWLQELDDKMFYI